MATPQGTYIDPKTSQPVSLVGTLGEQNVQANRMGLDYKPAVITSATPAAKTTQNIADLTTATRPKIAVPTYGQTVVDEQGRTGVAKFDPNTGLPLNVPPPEQKTTPEKKDTVVDGAIRKELGLPAEPVPVIKSQKEIDAEAGIASTRSQIETLQKTMDARSASIIQGIKDEYDSLVKQQEAQNKAYEGGVTTEGFRSGRARYAPIMQGDIIGRAISEGLGRISDLQAKKQSLILQAEQARDDKQFKYLNDTMEQYRNTVKEERKVAQDTYENALKASAEARAIAKEERESEKSAFDTSLTRMDRLAPSVMDAVDGLNEKEASDYILAISKDYGFDPNLFLGTINKLGQAQKEKLTTAVTSLAKDYPSAGIDPESDTFASASEKIRNSKEYKLDIQKAELDISNTRSLVSARTADEKVDYSDPVLTTYANVTGDIVSSPSKARAVMGYADTIAGDKEVVPDDFTGPLADNQIREGEYQQLINDAFSQFKKAPSSTEQKSDINQWLGTDEAMKMDDEGKKQFIHQLGGNPEDFGIW